MMKKIRVILIGGQSNAVGCTKKDTLDEKYRGGEYDNVYLYQEGNFTEEAKYKIIHGIRLGMGCKPREMGIEYGIAEELDGIGDSFALIRFAYGGTDLTYHWRTSFDKFPPESTDDKGYCYYAFVGTVKRGLDAFRDAGFEPTVEGMVWMQGESDTNKTIVEAEQYEDNLRTLFTAMRKELGMPELKIIVGGISTNPPLAPFSDVVRQKQQQYCDKDELAIYVDNTDIPIGDDGWHYNGNEDLKLGKRFGKYIKEFLL